MRQNTTTLDTFRKITLLIFALSIPLTKTGSLLAMAFVGFFAFRQKFRRSSFFRDLRKDFVFWGLVLFVLVFWLGLLWTEDLESGLRVCRRVSWALVVYVLCRGVFKGSEEGFLGVVGFVGGVGILDLLALGKFLGVGRASAFEFPSVVLMNPIWFGNLSALGIYGALVLLLRSSGRSRFFWAFLLGLGVLGVVLANSRGPLLACIGAFFSAFVFRSKGAFPRKMLSLLLGVLLISIWTVPQIHQKFLQVLEEVKGFFEQGEVTTSIGGRLGMWSMCFEMFKRSPLLGIGTGDYELEIKRLVPLQWQGILEYNQPHSIYFYSLALHGILGIVALSVLFFVALKEFTTRAKHGDPLALFSSMVLIHYLVAGLTETLFKIHVLVVAFGFALGASRAHGKGELDV